MQVAYFGRPVIRIDGRAKVTGSARYPSDEPVPNTAFGFLVTSPIAKGRITGIDLAPARDVPGVLDILTYENVGDRVREVSHLMQGGYTNSSARPLASAAIQCAGQIVALVVAETPEAADAAAYRLGIDYEEEQPAATLDSPGVETVAAADVVAQHEDPRVGDAGAAFATAPVSVDGHYATPIQHHNPLELFTTTCAWEGDKLTIFEPSRYIGAVKHSIAQQLDINPADVRVIARYIGGHFGSKLALSQYTALVALAARRLNRPVKLVPTRTQCFTIAHHRAETRHR